MAEHRTEDERRIATAARNRDAALSVVPLGPATARRRIWTMRTSTLTVMIAAVMVGQVSANGQDVVLIERGEAKAQIVVADEPSRVAMDAATLVQTTLRKMAGPE